MNDSGGVCRFAVHSFGYRISIDMNDTMIKLLQDEGIGLYLFTNVRRFDGGNTCVNFALEEAKWLYFELLQVTPSVVPVYALAGKVRDQFIRMNRESMLMSHAHES